jgi:hypothetical protein
MAICSMQNEITAFSDSKHALEKPFHCLKFYFPYGPTLYPHPCGFLVHVKIRRAHVKEGQVGMPCTTATASYSLTHIVL